MPSDWAGAVFMMMFCSIIGPVLRRKEKEQSTSLKSPHFFYGSGTELH